MPKTVVCFKKNILNINLPSSVVQDLSCDLSRLQDLVQDLQVAKQQTWEEKERLSAKYEEERKTNLANKVGSRLLSLSSESLVVMCVVYRGV